MSRILESLVEAPLDDAADPQSGFGALETQRGRLPLIALDVKSRISDLTAETTVRQTFRNSLDEPLEATYIFPLPDRAAVTKFQMRVADRTIDGELKERGAAREEYDRAIAEGHRAAIAEEERAGVFTLRVGNILPREEATVELTLVGPLPVADGEVTFRFPLVVAPRYTPGIPLDGPSVGAGVSPDTNEVPDASRVTPPVLLPGFPNPVRLSLEVQLDPTASGARDANWRDRIRSSLHSTITDEGPPWTIRLQTSERLNRDFILRFPIAETSVATSLKVSPAVDGKAGVFAITLFPPTPSETAKPTPREVVFVLDRSGSMEGWKMVAARRALGRMIDTLLDHDRFTVLAFDDRLESPPQAAEGFVSGTNRQRWQVLEWLGGIHARGGTQMAPAIEVAVGLLSANPSKSDATITDSSPAGFERMLVIVTDGQVTGEDAILKRLKKATGKVAPRIFTVGIDRAVNAAFLKRLANVGSGACELVESEERLDDAMNRIHRLIGAPVLTQVRLEPIGFEWVSGSLAPVRMPDLFVDRPATVFGRHLSGNTSLRIRVHALDAAGNAWREEVVGKAALTEMLTSPWGRAKVRDLEDEYASGQIPDRKKLMQQIVDVSLETHVLSRFTAYVAVDRSEVVNQGAELQQIVQPVELPDGWAVGSPPAYAVGFSTGLFRRARGVTSFIACKLSAPHSADSTEDFVTCDSADSMLQEFTDTAIDFTETRSLPESLIPAETDSSQVVRLVDQLLADAIRLGATEIQLQPLADRIVVRLRINGKLVERDSVPSRLLASLVSRIKTLATLDINENGKTQQGQLEFTLDSTTFKWSVTISPSTNGEMIVMTLDASQGSQSKKQKRMGFWK